MNIKKLLLTSLFLSAASFLFPQNAGDTFFAGIRVHTIKLQFDQPNYWDSLTNYYNQGNEQYIVAKVFINGTEIDSCGVRLKGNSSYSHPNNKKPMKIDFNQYRDGQRYDGLKGMFLNNCYSDPSFIREKIHLDFCRDAGAAAPRGTFAFVYINDSAWGLYSIVEPVDKKFLSAHYKNNDGNLYKAVDAFGGGAPGAGQTTQILSDFVYYGAGASGYTNHYELKTDDSPAPWTDLISVISALNNSADIASDLAAKVNLESVYKGIGSDILLASLDSYTESGRNFYVYFNEDTNKMEWIIWDTNMSFGGYTGGVTITPETLSLTYTVSASARPLTGKIFNTVALKTDYLKTVAQMVSGSFIPEKLYAHIDSITTVIRPYVVLDTRKQYTLEQFDSNIVSDVTISGGDNPGGGGPGGGGPGGPGGPGGGTERKPGIKSFIAARQANVKAQLASLGVTGVKEALPPETAPAEFNLAQNYPNPFNPATTINYSIPYAGFVTLKVYDILGKEVASVVNGYKSAGNYTAVFNAARLAGGVYFYQLKSGKVTNTKRMILLK
jgi:hypothetical protein